MDCVWLLVGGESIIRSSGWREPESDDTFYIDFFYSEEEEFDVSLLDTLVLCF